MAIKGSSVLVKKGTAAAGTTIGGMRTSGFSINSETVDVTTADNVSKWRELLPGAGVKNMSLTMSGTLDNVATHDQVIDDVIAQAVDAYALIIPDLGYFEGNFQISNIEGSGEYNGETTVSLTMESAGDITYTAGAVV